MLFRCWNSDILEEPNQWFNYLRHFNVENWYKSKYILGFPNKIIYSVFVSYGFLPDAGITFWSHVAY